MESELATTLGEPAGDQPPQDLARTVGDLRRADHLPGLGAAVRVRFVRPLTSAAFTYQKSASGLTGDPVAPLNGIGAKVMANACVPSSAQCALRSSKSQLSTSHRPIATSPTK
jgi:hypothetical protein